MSLRLSKYITIPALVFLLVPVLVFGQSNRSYFYDQIVVDIQTNKDSTVDITERQTYHFNGEYHQGWRSIPLKGFSSITDVVVSNSDAPLKYSSRRLNKLDPASWGHYTYFKDGNGFNIEWYFSPNDVHEWTLSYKVHGAISFLKDKDELYWNIFSDYSVPVHSLEVHVFPPDEALVANQIQSTVYTSSVPYQSWPEVYKDSTSGIKLAGLTMQLHDAPSYEKVTVAVGWPKGIVDQGAFWWWWLGDNILAIVMGVLIVLNMIGWLGYWYFTERFRKGTGTIIPEYEPVLNLRPAEVEVVIKESVTAVGWSATVVDLAVRGFLSIKEDNTRIPKFVKWAYSLFFIGIFIFLCFGFVGALSSHQTTNVGFMAVFFFFIIGSFVVGLSKFSKKDYFIERTGKDTSTLLSYESEFIKILCGSANYVFSTKELRTNQFMAKSIYERMKKNELDLYNILDKDNSLYDKYLTKEKTGKVVFLFMVIGSFFVIWLGSFFSPVSDFILKYFGVEFLTLPILVVVFLLLTLVNIWYFLIKYEARLSDKGNKAKEDLLGFKLYLKTAERYRLQNLTPDLFEKFLPYAMVFGVEKEWGKAFASLSVPPPSWYSGAYGGATMGSSSISSSGFSAGAFSSSFSSSFSSAFSSSGAGGGSGGGGSAGGGGGGGGGGAS